MSSKVVSVSSAAHLKSLLSSSTYVVVDFYADWCGPCKVISPVFEQLAAQEAKPGRLTFAKVNVDSQRDVAANYGVSAMPTFLVLKGSKVVETIRGANAAALRAAVLSAAANAAKGSAATSASFSGKGQTLGGEGSTSRAASSGRIFNINHNQLFSQPAEFAQGRSIPSQIVRFIALYITTLFSFDPVKTAEESPFAVRAVRQNNVRTR